MIECITDPEFTKKIELLFNKILNMKISNALFIIALVVSSFLTASCDNEEECLAATVRFTNTSMNPYDLYIDDAYTLRISGSTFQEFDLLEGQHEARVEQVSGFILFPTIVENTLNVFGCQESEWVFP